MRPLETSFRIISPTVCGNALAHIASLPQDGRWTVKITEKKETRSEKQKRLWWKWMRDLEPQLGDVADVIEARCKYKFVRPILFEREPILVEMFATIEHLGEDAIREAAKRLIHISDLSVADMTAALNGVERYYGAKGYSLTHPVDVYEEAMGR